MSVADESDKIVEEFLAESEEGLARLEAAFVELERAPESRELVDEAFRTLHTLKGNSSALGFPQLEAIAHAGESVLGRLRKGELAYAPALANSLLAAVDALRSRLHTIAQFGHDNHGDAAALLESLRAYCRPQPPPQADSGIRREEVAPAGDARIVMHPPRGEVRISADVLDNLMALTGEMVLAQSQALHIASSRGDPALSGATHRLKSVSGDLQQTVLQSRMRPISDLWKRLPRAVRDLASRCGKQVNLSLQGSAVELDRGIIDALHGPLMHLLRNAIDHGIETAEVRTRAGKPAAGLVQIGAAVEGAKMVLRVADDGRGLPSERLRRCAVQRGLISAEQAAAMRDEETANLTFLPGLSTAEKATPVSGRGVGLDVVKTDIERIGGSVSIESHAGRGTTVRLAVPLTLALRTALLFRCGGQVFAVPQSTVTELVRLRGKSGEHAIEPVCGLPVYRRCEGLLPVCSLREMLRLDGASSPQGYLVLVDTDGYRLALLVDDIQDSEELLVKPVGGALRQSPCFAGAAILSDAEIALVIDVAGLAKMMGVQKAVRTQS